MVSIFSDTRKCILQKFVPQQKWICGCVKQLPVNSSYVMNIWLYYNRIYRIIDIYYYIFYCYVGTCVRLTIYIIIQSFKYIISVDISYVLINFLLFSHIYFYWLQRNKKINDTPQSLHVSRLWLATSFWWSVNGCSDKKQSRRHTIILL